MDSDPRILLFSVVFFATGIYLFVTGFINLKHRKLIQNTPTSKINGLAMGLVEVFGKAVPFQNKIYKSPFSNTDCVYYMYTIEEYRSSGKSGHYVVIDSQKTDSPFFVQDDTGKVLVNPDGAKINRPDKNEFRSSGFGGDPSQIIQNFLKERGITYKAFLGNKSMRYTEYLIEPNDNIFVMGTADVSPFAPKDGVENEDNIMIQKGQYEKFFLISDSDEREVLKELGWKSFGGIFGGGLMSMIFLAAILLYFGAF